jgi:hypothetical protein
MAAFYIRRQNELYHHGIQGQKWGVRRYQNEDGTLTAEGRKRYGIEGLDSSKKDYNSRTAVKAYRKEFRARRRKVNDAGNEIEEEYRNDIENKLISDATKNKAFVRDWKNTVRDFYNEGLKTQDYNAVDKIEEKNIKKLSEKYPQYKELIRAQSIGEHILVPGDHGWGVKWTVEDSKKSFDKFMKSKNPIRDMLNNDYYHELTAKESKKVDNITDVAHKELDKYFMSKYGSEVISESNNKNQIQTKAIIAGTFMVPVLLAGGIGALIYNDLKNK